ncbi:class I SAM-dependent methyltransferase [Glaesserella parasuis]|uniref:class I SAM-dependent methyltransferase n=1 Tax=Glaesserella parasuis TaxID=738 RepID=UPI0024370D7F|nr:class I SAM-dependent methyltransferase [Glaesserella parasuis]MDG6267624.1 class I SAM-dependent methyltransferase [Glaesserella parasuis]
MKTSIYDNPIFFGRYLKLRENPISLNEVVEKPTMFSLLPDLNGKKVLDLGCGAGGHLLHYMAMGAKQVVGLDLSQSMLEQAEKDFAKNGVDPTAYRFYCLPMEVLSTIAESDFDLVTSSFAFHYIKDLSALLTQISAKLKPQGQLIFSQEHPIVTCFKEGERWEKINKQQVAYHLNYYRDEGERDRNWFQQSFKTYHRTTATILNTLIQSNFTIEQVEEPMLADQVEWHNEFKDLQHRPSLLFIKSVKK